MVTIPERCRVAAIVEPGKPLAIIEAPVPQELEPGAILVKMSLATICATDVHAWDGSSAFHGHGLPSVQGHEMTGRIVRLGPGVTADSVGTPLREGDRIVWSHGFCGQCVNCIVENERTLCLNRRGWHGSAHEFPYLTGGFAEYGYVYPTSGRIRVPDALPDEQASAASCALRTMVHGFDRLGELDDRHVVLIQGSGPLGLFSVARAHRSGVSQIIVIGGPKDRLEVARRWGATRTIDIDEVPNAADRAALVADWTGGLGPDVIIEVSGARTAFTEGFAMLRRGGRYLIVGQLHGESVAFQPADFVRKHARVIGCASAAIQHYHRALWWMVHNADRYDWSAMISNRYPLERVNEALARMQRWQEIKPVVTFD